MHIGEPRSDRVAMGYLFWDHGPNFEARPPVPATAFKIMDQGPENMASGMSPLLFNPYLTPFTMGPRPGDPWFWRPD